MNCRFLLIQEFQCLNNAKCVLIFSYLAIEGETCSITYTYCLLPLKRTTMSPISLKYWNINSVSQGNLPDRREPIELASCSELWSLTSLPTLFPLQIYYELRIYYLEFLFYVYGIDVGNLTGRRQRYKSGTRRPFPHCP
jgi:hypothetical protein